MKLGIAAVYLVSEENEALLDLHLQRIEKHTKVPYTIYAAANRLLPKLRPKLEEHPQVKIASVPTTDLKGSDENAYYLEHLIKTAIEDGVSHIAILHVDSFPIRSGWARHLSNRLSKSCKFAAVVTDERMDWKPATTCLFFDRDFYLKYQPRLQLSRSVLRSKSFEKYQRRNRIRIPTESGTGYGYLSYSEGLSWSPLLCSNKEADHHIFGRIYDNTIFHLGSASFRYKSSPSNLEASFRIRYFLSPFVPRPAKEALKSIIPTSILFRDHANLQREYERIRTQLLDEPDSYLVYLQSGKRERRAPDNQIP